MYITKTNTGMSPVRRIDSTNQKMLNYPATKAWFYGGYIVIGAKLIMEGDMKNTLMRKTEFLRFSRRNRDE
jgi:hypothetical protein